MGVERYMRVGKMGLRTKQVNVAVSVDGRLRGASLPSALWSLSSSPFLWEPAHLLLSSKYIYTFNVALSGICLDH